MNYPNFELIMRIIDEDGSLYQIRHKQYHNKIIATHLDLPLGIFGQDFIVLEHFYSGDKLLYSTLFNKKLSFIEKIYYKFDSKGKIVELFIKNDEDTIQEIFRFKYVDNYVIVKHFPENNFVYGYYKLKIIINPDNTLSKIIPLKFERDHYSTIEFDYKNAFLTGVKITDDEDVYQLNFYYDKRNRLAIFERIHSNETKKEVNEYQKDKLIIKNYIDNDLVSVAEYSIDYKLVKYHYFYYDKDTNEFLYSRLSDYKENKFYLFEGDLNNLNLVGYAKEEGNMRYVYNNKDELIYTVKNFYYIDNWKEIWRDANDSLIKKNQVTHKWVLRLIK